MAVLRRDFLPADFFGELRSNDMQSSIAVQADQSEAETEFLLELAAQNPELQALWAGWISALQNYATGFNTFQDFPSSVVFATLCSRSPTIIFFLRDDFLHGIALLSEFGFYLRHFNLSKQLPVAVKFAEKFAQQKFVLDHMGKPPIKSGEIQEWAAHIKAIAELPNVYCKVSGLVTEAECKNWSLADFTPYLDVAFEAFGAQRLMFGSDWPFVCFRQAIPASKQSWQIT